MSSATEVPFIDTTVLSAAATAELEDWGPLEEATSEEVPMQTHGLTMWTGTDGSGQSTGIWQCTAGPSYWVQEENEFIYILSGSLTVTPDGGKPATFGAGDSAMFPRGWRGTWDLHETVRKVYVLF
ncbi:MAG TPA: cupin domain-containing protein [Trebonia sp.]|jgi:uncharacterized cupin superfamily protein